MDKYEGQLPITDTVVLMCKLLANMRSKDPKTKVGACVCSPDFQELYFGYNGFSKNTINAKALWDGTDDTLSRHDLVIHAEVNAVTKALKATGDIDDYILFCTKRPCINCAKHMTACGIGKVFWPAEGDAEADKAEVDKLMAIFAVSNITAGTYALGHDIELINVGDKPCLN